MYTTAATFFDSALLLKDHYAETDKCAFALNDIIVPPGPLKEQSHNFNLIN